MMSDAISIYPNPPKDKINIKVDKEASGIHYVIYDALGIILKEGKPIENKIKIQDIQSGNYLICFLKQNTVVETIKFTIIK